VLVEWAAAVPDFARPERRWLGDRMALPNLKLTAMVLVDEPAATHHDMPAGCWIDLARHALQSARIECVVGIQEAENVASCIAETLVDGVCLTGVWLADYAEVRILRNAMGSNTSSTADVWRTNCHCRRCRSRSRRGRRRDRSVAWSLACQPFKRSECRCCIGVRCQTHLPDGDWAGKAGRARSRLRLRNKTRSSRPVWRMMTSHPAAWAPASAGRISGSPVTASLA
jgi:hypothetical protein